jgi:glycosyltransferase involved in cell wall biosynthesis
MKSVYVCYFGLREPLVQTQVLPYLRAIASSGVDIVLLTFEPVTETWTTAAVDSERLALAATGIDWHRRRYHKRPSVLATAFDIAVGARFVRRATRDTRVDLLHARGHVPALMATIGGGRRSKLLFDVRGFMPEEYVDAGLWKPNGLLFRTAKMIEHRLLRRADAFVVLTDRAKDLLTAQLAGEHITAPPIEVIPCCVDLSQFPRPSSAGKAEARRRRGLGGRTVALYLGSTAGFYLFDELVDFVERWRDADPSVFLSVITQRDTERVSKLLTARGFAPEDYSVRTVAPRDVATEVAAADVGLSFIKPTYSKQASSPTKIAEYLACGLPVVANAGVGDLDAQIAGSDVGVLVHRLDQSGYDQAIPELQVLLKDPQLSHRCRSTAETLFDLESIGGRRYVQLYERSLAS